MTNQLYVGTAQAAVTGAPATGIAIMGSSTNLGWSIFASDQYATIQTVASGHNSIQILFDAYMESGGTERMSAASNRPARITKSASSQLAIDIASNSGTAGSTTPTWTNAATFIYDGTNAGIQLPSPAGGTVTTLNHYTVDSLSITYTGPCTLSNVAVVATRIGRMIFLAFPSANCAAGSTATFTNSAGIPAEYRPAVSQCQPILGQANGVRVQMSINFATNGDSTIYNDGFCNGGTFSAGTSGPFSFTVALVST